MQQVKNKCLAYKGAVAVENKAWSLQVVVPLHGVDYDARICSQMGWYSLNTWLESYLGRAAGRRQLSSVSFADLLKLENP